MKAQQKVSLNGVFSHATVKSSNKMDFPDQENIEGSGLLGLSGEREREAKKQTEA